MAARRSSREKQQQWQSKISELQLVQRASRQHLMGGCPAGATRSSSVFKASLLKAQAQESGWTKQEDSLAEWETPTWVQMRKRKCTEVKVGVSCTVGTEVLWVCREGVRWLRTGRNALPRRVMESPSWGPFQPNLLSDFTESVIHASLRALSIWDLTRNSTCHFYVHIGIEHNLNLAVAFLLASPFK